MKKLNNKGIALVYTVLTMLLVFAICMLITTLMLAQITYYTAYSAKSEEKLAYSQIGDIFLQVKGDFFTCESGAYTDDMSAKTTPLCKALEDNGFDVASLHVVDKDGSLLWEGIKLDKKVLSFEFVKIESDSKEKEVTLVVYDNIKGQRMMLKVTIRVNGDEVTVVEWNRGE